MSRVEIEKVVIKIVRVKIEVKGTFSPKDTGLAAQSRLREKLKWALRQAGFSWGAYGRFSYEDDIVYEKDKVWVVFRGTVIDKYWETKEVSE